jgi:nitrate/nitrite-specific signal transduction histidine kinase
VVSFGSVPAIDVGDRSGIAPGTAHVLDARGRPAWTVVASALTAPEYASQLAGTNTAAVVRSNNRTLGSTLPAARGVPLPSAGTLTISGREYRALTQHLDGFGQKADITVLSDLAATRSSVRSSQLVAAIFIAAFLLLAVAFAILASGASQGQLSRFLAAARRLAGDDFSSPVPTRGHDESAALGAEFNSMSRELERRIDELGQERARLCESIRRIGETFASNLDRQALLELALQTAIAAVHAESGRLSMRDGPDSQVSEVARLGSLDALEGAIHDAEHNALDRGSIGKTQEDEAHVASISLLPAERGERIHGLITVAVKGRSFSDDDYELLRSLVSQASLVETMACTGPGAMA